MNLAEFEKLSTEQKNQLYWYLVKVDGKETLSWKASPWLIMVTIDALIEKHFPDTPIEDLLIISSL